MAQINMIELYKQAVYSPYAVNLVKYIFRVQGESLKRLDFSAAAAELGLEWKEVKRECDKLEKHGLIIYEGNGLKLNPAIIKVS